MSSRTDLKQIFVQQWIIFSRLQSYNHFIWCGNIHSTLTGFLHELNDVGIKFVSIIGWFKFEDLQKDTSHHIWRIFWKTKDCHFKMCSDLLQKGTLFLEDWLGVEHARICAQGRCIWKNAIEIKGEHWSKIIKKYVGKGSKLYIFANFNHVVIS